MTERAAMTPSIKTSNLSNPNTVACPKCDAKLKFTRSDYRHIDECGFESYSLKSRNLSIVARDQCRSDTWPRSNYWTFGR